MFKRQITTNFLLGNKLKQKFTRKGKAACHIFSRNTYRPALFVSEFERKTILCGEKMEF